MINYNNIREIIGDLDLSELKISSEIHEITWLRDMTKAEKNKYEETIFYKQNKLPINQKINNTNDLVKKLWGDDESIYNIESKDIKLKGIEQKDKTFELPLMELIDKTQNTLSNRLSDKNVNSLNYLFLRENKKTIEYAESHNELYEKMYLNYKYKSQNALNYFISNIANTYNRLTNQNMIDFNDEKNLRLFNSLAKNINYTNKEYTKTKIKSKKSINKKGQEIDKPYFEEINEDIINYSLDEQLKGEFLLEQDKKYSAEKLGTIFYLQEIVDKKEEEYYAYMITFTNPSENIFYKQKKNAIVEHQGDFKDFIKNPNYDKNNGNFEESIVKGAELQKEINRHFYLSLKKKIERFEAKKDRSKVYHFTIFENTKQLHLHSHKLMMIPRKYHQLLVESFDNTNKHFNLKQVKFDELEEIEKEENENMSTGQKLTKAKGSSYVFKYLFKTLKINHEDFTTDDIKVNREDYYFESDKWFEQNESRLREEKLREKFQEAFDKNIFFNVYRRYFGANHRMFTYSNFEHTTQKKLKIMYKYLKENCTLFLKKLKEQGSLYYQLEQLELQGVFEFEKGSKLAFKFNIEKIEERLEELKKEHKEELLNEYKSSRNKVVKKIKRLKDKGFNDKTKLKATYKANLELELKLKNIFIKDKKDLFKLSKLKAKHDLIKELHKDLSLFCEYKEDNQSKYIEARKDTFIKKCNFSLIKYQNALMNKNESSENEEKELIYHHEMYSLGGFALNDFFSLH